jgi:hypothetical protein
VLRRGGEGREGVGVEKVILSQNGAVISLQGANRIGTSALSGIAPLFSRGWVRGDARQLSYFMYLYPYVYDSGGGYCVLGRLFRSARLAINSCEYPYLRKEHLLALLGLAIAYLHAALRGRAKLRLTCPVSRDNHELLLASSPQNKPALIRASPPAQPEKFFVPRRHRAAGVRSFQLAVVRVWRVLERPAQPNPTCSTRNRSARMSVAEPQFNAPFCPLGFRFVNCLGSPGAHLYAVDRPLFRE